MQPDTDGAALRLRDFTLRTSDLGAATFQGIRTTPGEQVMQVKATAEASFAEPISMRVP
jgi:hypothetical protein